MPQQTALEHSLRPAEITPRRLDAKIEMNGLSATSLRASRDRFAVTLFARAKRAAVIGAALGLSGCKSGILDPQGPIGSAEKTILLNSLAIMLAIVIPTILATLWFAWWFRESNPRARYLPDWAYSGRIELVVWSIPTLVIIFLGGITWIGSHELDPAAAMPSKTKPLEVQVVSLDWKWLFIYPEQGIASGQSVRCSRGNADPFFPDFGECDECVLRPATRKHDLHDERHDDAALSAGGSAGRFLRPIEPFQRRRLSWNGIYIACRRERCVRGTGLAARRTAGPPSTKPPIPNSPSKAWT